MYEEAGPEEDDVYNILAQESSELLHILRGQSPDVIMQLTKAVSAEAGLNIDQVVSSASALTEHIKAMLEYFRSASAADCRNFLQSMCLLCENIPMHLESRLMSVAGCPNDGGDSSRPSDTDVKSSSPPSEQLLIKRPRIDYWEQYIAAVMSLLRKRWERHKPHMKEVHLDSVWVCPRMANRSKDRPDQTPGSTDRGSRTPEPDGDYGSVEGRVTLETFLHGCAGKVTVLLGQAGSGKTLLMSRLGQQWANGLGPIPSSSLFILLEFRQLSLLSRPLSLSELLFRQYLPTRGDDDEKQAILDYLLANPEQSCWVLDGYDEFHSKLCKQEKQREPLDPKTPLPVLDLISGLLNHQLLPGCTIVITCRVRDAMDLEGIADKVGLLQGWENQEILEYVHNYFRVQAHGGFGEQAADLLFSSQHLLAMSSLPGLCNICCICLEHLLQVERTSGGTQTLGGRTRETQKTAREEKVKGLHIQEGGRGSGGSHGASLPEGRGGSADTMMDVTNGRAQLLLTQAQIPSTLTQVYLTVLGAFLSRDPDKEQRSDTSVICTLSQYQSELCELSHLAWKGLEESKILFMEEEIPQNVLEFCIKTGLFSQVEVRCEDGTTVNSYFFIHLTLQEFLGAIRLMTSQDVSDAQLKKRFSLKTRWTTKVDQRTVFTDSLHLFVCGLASKQCTKALVQIVKTSSGSGVLNWVKKRQALVLKLLKSLCHSNTLTGPKVLELCHCVQETQDHQLAKEVLEVRPILELRNIRLLPNDIDALAFVVNSVGETEIGLDFGACSMDLECLDTLTRCQNIHYLCFRSRKYGDMFAQKLSTILSKFTSLRKLEFCGACLTATGAASLASGLQNCPHITKVNLSDNNLKDEGIELMTDVLVKLPKLVSIMFGRNNWTQKGVEYLIRKMSSYGNIQHIHANGMKELTVTFSESSGISSHQSKPHPTISLLNQKWSEPEMQELARSLACCPVLSVLDLSGGQWDLEILRTLTQFIPKFTITKKIILNESCSSVGGLVILTALLSDCPAVMELRVRLQSPVQVSVVFAGQQSVNKTSKTLCLCCCGLLPADLERVWQSLGESSDLTLIDLSSNCLDNKGLKKLLGLFLHLKSIQEINLTNNRISMGGVGMLAAALCSHRNLTQVHISDGGGEKLILKFCPDISSDKGQQKIFRFNNSSLQPADVATLCRRLVQCHTGLELDFSHSSLSDNAIENLLKVLPRMTALQRLNVSHSISSTSGAVTLASCLTVSQRVKSVELRPLFESFVHFDTGKAEQASCSLVGFILEGDDCERLLSVLQQHPKLSYLDLTNNQLQDEGVKRVLDSLPKLKPTRYINLSSNSLTQQGLLDVVNALCVCDNVSGVEISLEEEQRCLIWFLQEGECEKTLSVRGCSLEHDHLVRLAEMLSHCPGLTELNFRNNSLKSSWIVDFVKLLSSSQSRLSFSFEECWIRSAEAVSLVCLCLKTCSNLHTISVHCSTLHLSLMKAAEPTTDRDNSAQPTQSMGPRKICLVDCGVEGHQLAPLSSILQRCPLLTDLDFSHNTLGITGADFLTVVLPKVPNLTSLSICSKENSPAVAEKLSETLLQAASIQCLNLSGHVISDAAAQSLTRVLPRLRSLNLSHCFWGLQLIKALGQCVSLESLCLDSVQLNEESRVCLAQSLRSVNAICVLKLNKVTTADGGLGLLTAMEGLTQMKEIELEGWRLTDDGVEQLTRLLPLWKDLKKISLSKNLISDQSGDKLMEALKCCGHLEELNLSSNQLGDLTAARMALVLPSLTHITVLDLSENLISDEGSRSLSKAIKGLKNLTRINLTSVGTPELSAVAASLSNCPLIQDVRLGWNGCEDKVAEELAGVIPLCQKMTIIDLESNKLSVSGAEALVRALQSSPALQLIRLWRNKISLSEAQKLSQRDRRLNFSST
ncbi:protein NLRC5 [Halichoeres trimaculatus]|uniref:protein NLRC5 n=1 Tax=Halichoeres trimaculatus TaxID=147232 RepID=UPI003D9F0CBD